MLPTERIAFSAITERPPLELPGNARMVVWIIVNIEEWDPKETMPRTVLTPPAGGSPSPDIPNWAWHEYGNRVLAASRSARQSWHQGRAGDQRKGGLYL
jgi:allantoinase